MTQHPFHIFECLRALNSIVFSPVRDYSVYDKLLYLNEVAFGKYISYAGEHEWPYWLQVRRPDFEGFPVMPTQLVEWVADWGGQTPEQPPKIKKYHRNSPEIWQESHAGFSQPLNSGLYGERFDDQPERVNLWSNWLQNEWLPWAYLNKERFSAIDTYEKLLLIYNQLQRSEQQFELVVANAVLLWRYESTEIRHPLLTQKMELEYLPEQGVFSLVAKSAPARLEYDMLYDITGIDLNKLFAVEQQLFEQPADLREPAFLAQFSNQFAELLGHGCITSTQKLTPASPVTSQPCIYYGEPLIFLRRQDGRKWRGELEGIVETIDTGVSLPELFSPYYANTQIGEDTSGRNWKDNLAQPFFPWDGEPAHKEILRHVAAQPLTVVQAPAKSSQDKLLANLLVHFLAHGKRVLVTGNDSRSLKKVSSLIYQDFPQLASLCVSATGTDRENTRELLSSLRAHSQKMSYNSKDEIARELAELQKRLGVFQQELAEDLIQVQSSRELEYSRRFQLEGQDLAPWQVAKWLLENKERLGYIPDRLGHDQECPLVKKDMSRFFELLGQVALSAGEELMLWLPKQSELLPAEQLEELFAALTEAETGSGDRKALLADCLLLAESSAEEVREMLLDYQQALAELPGIEGDWLNMVLQDIVAVPQKLKVWQDLHQSIATSAQKVNSLLLMLNEYIIVLPENFDFRKVRDALYKLRIEFYKHNKLSLFFKLSAGKQVLAIYNECTIDGQPAQSAKDIDLLLAKVDYLDELRRMAVKWNNVAAEVAGPRVEPYEPGFVDTLERYCVQVKRAIEWRKKYLSKLNAAWEKFARQQPPQWTDRNWLAGMLPRLQAWLGEKKYAELTEQLLQQYNLLGKNSAGKELHPLCNKFRQAIDEKDSKLWQECHRQLAAVEEKKRAWLELEFLHDKLAEAAPLWAKQLTDESAGNFVAVPEEWPLAWKYQQAQAWLQKHTEGNKLEEITQRYYQRKAKEKDLIHDVAAKSAWYWQLKRITAEEKRALDFLLSKNDLQYTDNFSDEPAYEFLREADFWRLSLPAWIMPIDILLETAGPFDRLFDVVIIVDSEKCDVFSSCLLLRGKKAIVVGDSQLPGTVQPAQGRAAANLLLEKSLLGLPNKIKFDLHDSLYSFMLRLSDDEHSLLTQQPMQPVRINSFLSKYFYHDSLCLIEQSCSELSLLPQIIPVVLDDNKLTGASNKQEAAALVQKVTELLRLPEYSGKSFALLTLGALEQQELLEQLVTEKISEEVLAKRRLICSSVDSYQAGSRDVVLLSMVSAKTAQLADPKKINAAMSLAREQIYLFLPFAAEEIAQHSLVCNLLDATAPKPAEETTVAAEQTAVPAVLKDMLDLCQRRGYEASACYSCANLPERLDLCIKSNGRKAGIILDGLRGKRELDSMFIQEQALQRNGWPLWHVRASSFYLNQEATLAEIDKFLDKLLL